MNLYPHFKQVALDSRRSELYEIELGPDLLALTAPEMAGADGIAARCRGRDIMLVADAELTWLASLGGLSASADAIAVAELAATRPDLHCAAEPIYLRAPDISQPKPRKP